MTHPFVLYDLLALLLAVSAVSFMIWVFWNFTYQIRLSTRTRVAPSRAMWKPARKRQRDEASSIPPRIKIETTRLETTEQRFASRIPH